MHLGRMLRHGLGLQRREPQADTSSIPTRIDNPTASLPSSIGAPASATVDPAGTGAILTAQASTFTTVTEIRTQSLTTNGVATTFTTGVTRTITNSAEYASITSAASSSHPATTTKHSTTSAAATSSAAASHSSSNLGTLIPAIVVPVAVVLVASLGIFWFFMRRRHRRELQSQPEFIMTGKGEKLSSRSSSNRSTTSNPASLERKPPVVFKKELPSAISPPTLASEWPSIQTGLGRSLSPQGPPSREARPTTEQQRNLTASSPYRNFRTHGQGPRPATAGRPGPPSSAGPGSQGANRSRSNSSPGQRGPGLPSRPAPVGQAHRTAPSPVIGSGRSPLPQDLASKSSPQPPPSAFRFRDPSPNTTLSNRAQAPQRLAAPPPGAFNGASSISQYSPIVKDAPEVAPLKVTGGKRPPPPINTADLRSGTKSPKAESPPGHGLTEENLRIARLANSSRLGYPPAEPSPSPKLPPPATRSQLIPRESPKESQDRFFGGGNNQPGLSRTAEWSNYNSKRASVVSDADEYEDIDAKSDVSSLNEFERFDFGNGIGSGRGSPTGPSLTFFAAQNSPASERGSAFGTNNALERW